MPAGIRTDAISPRDLEVLEFIARFGVVPRSAVSTWAATARAATLRRERRLRIADLVKVDPGVGGTGRILVCTRRGLRAVARDELRTPQLSPARVGHESIVARLAAEIELAGDWVLSEREIAARERAEDKRILSAALPGGRYHRPDLIRIADTIEAIEVELTTKSARRLDEILRSWRRAISQRKVARVRYLCSARARAYVERGVERTKTEGLIAVASLRLGSEAAALE